MDALAALGRRLRLPPLAPGPIDPGHEALERRILFFGARLAIVAAAVQTVVHLANVIVLSLRVDLLNADRDFGVFTWASTLATFAGALLVALLALVWDAHRWLLLGLAATLSYFSLDDNLGLHERVAKLGRGWFGIEQFGHLLWPLVFMPLLAFAFAALWALSTALRPAAARLLRGGLGLLVVAVFLEVFAGALLSAGLEKDDLSYAWEVVAEEGAELAAWILIATALATALVSGLLSGPRDYATTSSPEASAGSAERITGS